MQACQLFNSIGIWQTISSYASPPIVFPSNDSGIFVTRHHHKRGKLAIWLEDNKYWILHWGLQSRELLCIFHSALYCTFECSFEADFIYVVISIYSVYTCMVSLFSLIPFVSFLSMSPYHLVDFLENRLKIYTRGWQFL